MRGAMGGAVVGALAVVSVVLGCSRTEPPKALQFDGAIEYVESEVDSFPRIRYADGLVTANDRCPVRKAKLNRKMTPVYANGRPIGFC